MIRSIRFSVVLLGLWLISESIIALAQSPPMSPDRKALTDATRIKEPDKKIEALEKFIADNPRSTSLFAAHQAIFETLVKNYPDQKEKILAQAGLAIEKAQDFSRPFVYDTLANRLFDAGVMLDEAEKLATKGLAVTEEELLKQAKQRKSGYYATLGRINLKQGKLKEAEQHLKQARDFNPNLVSASIGLAELYVEKGDEKLALETYVTAAARGKLPPEPRKQFESLYSKSNKGSLQGLEEMLDAAYTRLYPLPIKVEHYRPSDKRANRTVLAEVFTGSGCPPCVAADLGFEAMMERYKRDELAVLMFHLHIPMPDPMTNPATQARAKFYGVSSVPSFTIDGKLSGSGGTREMTQSFYDRVNPDVEKQLETAAAADLKLDVALDGLTVKTKVAVSNIKSESDKLKLQIVLAEDKLRYTGENGIRFHPMVVRALAGPEYGGLAITSKDGQSFDWSFDVSAIKAEVKKHLDEYEKSGLRGDAFTFSEKKDEIDPNNLTVVAYVQDETSKTVLQAVLMKAKSSLTSNANLKEK
jgi:tetratricopeptide (TPR) repeat protein